MGAARETTGAAADSRWWRWPLRFLTVGAALVLLDSILYDRFGPRHLRGVDFFIVALASGFLLTTIAWRKGRARLTLAALSTLFAVGAVEVVIAVLTLGSDRPSPWYVWPPGFRRVFLPEGLVGVSPQGEFSTNSRGIRGPEFTDTDRVRILCVGGSTTECIYLDDAKAWPHLLMERLNERVGPGVWVGNVGRSGLTALDHLTYVEHLPEARIVDTWIVLCGGNDFGHRLRGIYDEKASHPWNEAFKYRRPGLAGGLRRPYHRNLFIVQAIEDLRQRLELIALERDGVVYQDVRALWIHRQRHKRRSDETAATLPHLEPWLDDYERVLKRIVATARSYGVTVVFATQPTLWSESMTPEATALCLGSRTPEGYLPFGALARGLARFNERMRLVCDREGVPCVDLASLLPKTIETFYDDFHFNEPGAERVAKHLADAIAPLLSSKIINDGLRSARR